MVAARRAAWTRTRSWRACQRSTCAYRLRKAGLSGLDLVALMVDGVHFGESCCVVALGIDEQGTKHPLALVEGATENATVVTDLLTGLRQRGLDVTRPILVGIDGAKALYRAVVDVFDHPVIQRCQLHKIRNVQDRLPQRLRGPVGQKMRQAYHADSTLDAEAQLSALAGELDKTHPGAAASLREGLTETLTVLRLGVPPTLARTLRSTNAIESMISICRTHSATSSAGATVRWRCAGAPRAWSRPASSSAGSTVTCTWRSCASRSTPRSPELSHPPCRMRRSSQPDAQRAATEVPRTSGQPQMGIWTRTHAGQAVDGLIHHSDRGGQYLAIRYTRRLAEAGAVASVGSCGDCYDNAWPRRSTRCSRPRRSATAGRGRT